MNKLIILLLFICSTYSFSQENLLYIIEPLHNQEVSNPVVVKFGLKNMGVAPAGVDRSNTGHHHLLIDVKNLPNLTRPIPSNQNYIHFGGGQTETEIFLKPGKHELQLILGDYSHTPHATPLISEKITINVKN